MKVQTFALYFGNRGLFPEALIASAREEIATAVEKAGFAYLMPPADMTRCGAVETKDEGLTYAAWLKSHEGEYDGIIMSLPNFSDKHGAVAAVANATKPIIIQAYPDEVGKAGLELRRDAYSGKLSICDMLQRHGIPFTVMEPHVVHPSALEFDQNLKDFAAVCRVVNGIRHLTIGVIGAKTAKSKPIRYDEITLQKHGITCKIYDLSELLGRVEQMTDDARIAERMKRFANYTDFSRLSKDKARITVRVSLAIDDIMQDHHLDCITLHCEEEMHSMMGISAHMILNELNDRGIAASREIDPSFAINFTAMRLASKDFEENHSHSAGESKVTLFHCGPVTPSFVISKGAVTDHRAFAKGHTAGVLRMAFGTYLGYSITELVVADLKQPNQAPLPSAMGYVAGAKKYIATHYKEKIRIADIAAQLSISEGHLRAVFKDHTDMTLTDYINRYRIEKACSLLRTTHCSLQEMASRVGISDPAYLSRLFRKITGMTYSEFYQHYAHEAYKNDSVDYMSNPLEEVLQNAADMDDMNGPKKAEESPDKQEP